MVSSFDKYDAELKAFRQLLARVQEHYPDLSLEQCLEITDQQWYDPQFERDPAFRNWLLRQVSVAGQADVRSEDQ